MRPNDEVQQPQPPTRQEAQIRLILSEFGRDVVGLGPEGTTPADARYLFRQGHLLVRDEYLPRVQSVLWPERRPRGQERPSPETIHGVAPGVSRLRLPPEMDVLTAVAQVKAALGPDVAAPDHVMSVATIGIETFGAGGHCPATEPEVVPAGTAPDPGLSDERAAGDGVRVVVVDTGLDPAAADTHPWMRGVQGEADPGIQPNGTLEPYAGHGTFIAGIVRTVAPLCEVSVISAFKKVGVVFESELVQGLDAALDRFADIVVLSSGTETYDTTGLLSFDAFSGTRLRQHKGVVFVTAAGNNASRASFWPAKASWTVSVGALGRDRRTRAAFSNFGGWVDVYAPGEDLINAFPTGDYTYREPPLADTVKTAHFEGMCKWSGTSFSTPIVAGMIAARMSRTGENGRAAAAALLADAQDRALPGVGAVLLPS